MPVPQRATRPPLQPGRSLASPAEGPSLSALPSLSVVNLSFDLGQPPRRSPGKAGGTSRRAAAASPRQQRQVTSFYTAARCSADTQTDAALLKELEEPLQSAATQTDAALLGAPTTARAPPPPPAADASTQVTEAELPDLDRDATPTADATVQDAPERAGVQAHSAARMEALEAQGREQEEVRDRVSRGASCTHSICAHTAHAPA